MPGSFLTRLANDALFFLQNSSSPEFQSQHNLLSYRAASLVVIRAECTDKGLLYRYFNENALEVCSHHLNMITRD